MESVGALGSDSRPACIGSFGSYAEAAGAASSRPGSSLHPPEVRRPGALASPGDGPDVFGHVNNAAYWQALEQCLPASGVDPKRPLRALLGYRHAIDLGEEVELVRFEDDGRRRCVRGRPRREGGRRARGSLLAQGVPRGRGASWLRSTHGQHDDRQREDDEDHVGASLERRGADEPEGGHEAERVEPAPPSSAGRSRGTWRRRALAGGRSRAGAARRGRATPKRAIRGIGRAPRAAPRRRRCDPPRGRGPRADRGRAWPGRRPRTRAAPHSLPPIPSRAPPRAAAPGTRARAPGDWWSPRRRTSAPRSRSRGGARGAGA